MSLPIAIAGAAGRMGRTLISAASASADFTIVGATERAGVDVSNAPAPVSPDVRTAASNAKIWIDFTAPAATLAALEALRETPVTAAIIGTTGFTPEQEQHIAAAAQRIAIVRSGNFSLGVNLIAALAEQAAARLGADWDVEIYEAHHRHKRDAPSGTALLLANAVAVGKNAPLESLRLPAREGDTGPRPEGGIGFAVSRGGGIIGEHEVMFAGEREVIRLSHQTLDRAVFADGALAAARWASGKPPGLYSMRDVLGL